jgi:hypothetical protein
VPYIFRTEGGEPTKRDSSFCHLNLICTDWMCESVTVGLELLSKLLFEWCETLRHLPSLVVYER